MAEIVVDESQWPLVVVHWPKGEIANAVLEAYLDRSRAQMAKKQLHLVLHEAVADAAMSAHQRRIMADYVKEQRENLRAYVVAAAVVAPSVMIRGLITAVNWMSPSPFPQKVFASRAEAEVWLRSMMR